MGVDPNLVAAIMVTESGGNPLATSYADAQGLMQVVPKYHACATYKPGGNLKCAIEYLAGLIAQYEGDTGKALAHYYNGWQGPSRPWVYEEYVNPIMTRWEQYKTQ